MTHTAPGGLLLCMFALGGCGEGEPAASPAAAPAAATSPAAVPAILEGPYRVVPVEHAGRVVGTCRLVGHPEPAKLRPWPAMGFDETRDDESVVVGEKSALGGCVVSLAVAAEGKDWPSAMRGEDRTATLTVVDGRYEPHLLVVRTFTQLEIVSRIAHNFSMRGSLTTTSVPARTETIFNFSVDPGARLPNIADAFLTREGVVRVSEHRYNYFTAWIHVVANPYFDVTHAPAVEGHAAGEFRLEAVPAGDYDLVCWHEPMDRREELRDGRLAQYRLGPPIVIRRHIRVTAGATTTVDFDVEQPARK